MRYVIDIDGTHFKRGVSAPNGKKDYSKHEPK